MKPARVLLPLLLLLSPLVAQVEQPPEIAPSEYFQLVLENRDARVWLLQLPPGAATAEHMHLRDYVFVAVTAGRLRSSVGPKTETINLEPGAIQVANGSFPHRLEDANANADASAGREPFRAVVIELARPIQRNQVLCGLGRGQCGAELGGISEDRYSITTVLETEYLKIADVRLEAGTTTARHEHNFPHLAIAITPLRLRSDPSEGEPIQIERAPGAVDWIPGGFAHKLTNLSDQPVEWITLEFR